MSNFQYGTVLIEEKVPGEESSCMGFCDGKHFIPLPDTRDYKRAFDGDRGPTRRHGFYKDVDDYLPFLTAADREAELALARKVFNGWKKENLRRHRAARRSPLLGVYAHGQRVSKFLR